MTTLFLDTLPSSPLFERMYSKPCTSQASRHLTPPLTLHTKPLSPVDRVLTTCGSPECRPVPPWALVPCLGGRSSVLVSASSSPGRTLKCLQGWVMVLQWKIKPEKCLGRKPSRKGDKDKQQNFCPRVFQSLTLEQKAKGLNFA